MAPKVRDSYTKADASLTDHSPHQPASTAGKAPASTASKAPAKTETPKAAKKTASKSGGSAPVDGEKKKRKKARKETYSSYIYKGACAGSTHCPSILTILPQC